MVLFVTVLLIAVAVGMQVLQIRKTVRVCCEIRGAIRSRADLARVKQVINLSMGLAIAYIVLVAIYIILLVVFVRRGTPLAQVAISLLVFGAATLPMGLIGRRFDKRIRSLRVESDDPDMADTFARYLIQWNQPRIQLPD